MRVPLQLLRLLAGLVLAAPAAAQLDLPDAPRETPRGASGTPKHAVKRSGIPGLDLPAAGSRPARKAEPEAVPTPGPPAPGEVAPLDRARALLEELRGVRSPDSARVAEVAEELAGMGQIGLQAARVALESDSGPERVAALRVLLERGREEDRRRVVASLRERVPPRATTTLLDALAELDPVAASPRLWIDLLAHPQGSMRAAAERRLSADFDPSLLPELESALDSHRADTRLRVLDLVETVRSPRALDMLFESLGDEDARVAARAAKALARSQDPAVGTRLLEEVRGRPALSRAESYAVLAIVEREDLSGEVILGMDEVDDLLANLAGVVPLASGVAACALAGIGFRSESASPGPWLDLVVPHHLVRIVSGTEFHEDLLSLQDSALRRLSLITGRDFGSDGRAWQSWWVEAASGFRARRAALPLTVDRAPSIRVDFRDPVGGDGFAICGEAVSLDLVSDDNVFVLPRQESVDLFRVLEKEGLFTARRLPSPARAAEVDARRLRLVTPMGEKSFTAAASAPEPWFDRVVEVLESLRARNRWQEYYPLARRKEDPGRWLAERQFWAETTQPVARDRRLKGLVLARLDALQERPLARALTELEGLFAHEGVPDPADCQPLLQRVSSEPFHSLTVGRLTHLAVRAGRAQPGSEARSALDGEPAMDPDIARELALLLAGRFGARAEVEIAEVFRARPAEWVRPFATEGELALRAGVALALGSDPDPSSGGILVQLLSDDEFEVEAAAVRGLGVRCSELADRPDAADDRKQWTDAILERARSGRGGVRIAALKALGRSDDERAVGVLLPGVSDEAAAVRRASAEALAERNDPTLAPILVSLLARGPESEVFAPARAGLVRLGPGAQDQLLSAMHRKEPGLSREAALILAEGCVPEAASTLLALLTEDPGDERVAFELAVLTAVDFRDQPDPPDSWWTWWDTVRHDDAQSWLLAAAERAGVRAPEAESLEGRGTRAGGEFLIDLAAIGSAPLAERARRELARRLGAEVEMPVDREEREAFLDRYWPR